MEIWKSIPGYEGSYMVSNYGRVRSLDRLDSRGHKVKGRILKQNSTKYGYKQVNLSKNGAKKMLSIHRLVATAFVPNPNEYLEVNHIDENKSNNKFENLEWCDRTYNMNYGTRNERAAEKKRGKHAGAKNPRARKVMCLNNGMVFDCMKEAREWCGLKGMSIIGKQIKGKIKYAGKDPVTGEPLTWQYLD